MKKSLSTLLALMLGFPLAVLAQGTMKIGTVDMQRAFKEYNKTKEAEAKINDAKNAARKEYDDRAQDYKKALDEINNLNKQLESPALSADKKTQTAKERDDKISKIKNMEREISDFRQTRERHHRRAQQAWPRRAAGCKDFGQWVCHAGKSFETLTDSRNSK